jgi:hypothetical protein
MEADMNPSGEDRAPVSRERLYQEVWSEPMTSVAKKYGVSGSFLARVCTLLNVPRPPRGYWARLAAGYTVHQRPSLPNPKPGGEIEWARFGQARRAPLKLETQTLKKKRRKRSELPAIHPLLEGFQERLNEGRESYFSPFIRPIKRLLPDIIATKKVASRAIDVANELYLSLEAQGYQVMFSPRGQILWRHSVDEREKSRRDHQRDLWSPSRPTVVLIGAVAIGLTVYEMTEYVEVQNINGEYVRVTDLTPQQIKTAARSYSWTSTRDMQSGRLCIQAYSPYPGTQWRRQWQEAKVGDFPSKLPAIIKELEAASASIAKQVEEAERKAEIERQQREQQREIERQRWEAEKAERARKEAEQRRIQAEKDSREELSGIINAWAKAKRIEEFFAEAERRAADLGDDEKSMILERLKLARGMVGGTDALQWFGSWKAPDER